MKPRATPDRTAAANTPPAAPAPPAPSGMAPLAWAVGAVAALCAAGPLLPGENLAAGDGLTLAGATLAVAAVAELLVARSGLSVRPTWGDGLVGAWFGWLVLCGLLAATSSPARPALNFAAQAAAGGALFHLVRLLIARTPQGTAAGALVRVMIGQAAVLAIYGLVQVSIELPQLRAELAAAADPDAFLREAGVEFAATSATGQNLRNRLAGSEPFATFALTNSLAGFLAPWLVIAVGLLLAGPRPTLPAEVRSRRFAWGAVALVFLCLILTKSRTAWLACLLGPLAAGLLRRGLRLSRAARLTVVVALAAVGIAVLVDGRLASEAGKSLGYRFQYWRGAVAVWAESPWLGCGPGRFGDRYLRFKEPTASEEILDPHQMFLETAAVTGLPGLLLLVAVCLAVTWAAFRPLPAVLPANEPPELAPAAHFGGALPSPSGDADRTDREFAPAVRLGGACGGAFGVLLRLVEWNPPTALGSATLAGLPAVWNRLAPTFAVSPDAFRTALGAGWLTWVVHLQASGGIFYPGTAATGWLLAALLLPSPQRRPDEPSSPPGAQEDSVEQNRPDGAKSSRRTQENSVAQPRPGEPNPASRTQDAATLPDRPDPLAALRPAVWAVLFAATYFLCLQPFQTWNALRRTAPSLHAAERIARLAADPWSPEPAREAAGLALAEALARAARGEAFDPRDYETARDEFVRRRGASEDAASQVGLWEWTTAEFLAARANGGTLPRVDRPHADPAPATRAARAFAAAVSLYPHSPLRQARLALAEAAAGNRAAAVGAARRALELHALTPHADKKLPPELLADMEILEKS